MKISRLISVCITALLFSFTAFLIGFVTPDAVDAINSKRPRDFVASLSLLPDRIEQLAGSSSQDDQSQLPVIDTYWTVLNELSDKYYGKKIDEREMTYSAIRGMLEALNDPYTRFLDPKEAKDMREQNEGNFVGIGAHLDTDKKTHQVYVKEPLEDSPAKEKGLKAGDIIIKVDGKPIAGMDIEDVVSKIRGKQDTVVRLTIHRPKVQKLMEFRIVRRMVQYQMVPTPQMVDETRKIGYIKLRGFNEKSDEQFNAALSALEKRGMKALILDLRDNPGGLLTAAVDIGSRFVESGPIVIIQERGNRRSTLDVETEKHNHKRYPLAVLVNGRSASASEIVAGAIHDNHVGTLIGTTTFGKGKVQTIVPLADFSSVSITTAKYLTPAGTDINKVGIKPDLVVEVPDTVESQTDTDDITKNDKQLLKAEDFLRQELSVADGSAAVAEPKPARGVR
jgi:carboxyl-terminal processing protease